MNKWPVLFLSLKDVNGDTFEDAYEMLCFPLPLYAENMNIWPEVKRFVTVTGKYLRG